jgi:riboflavin synthase
MAVIHPAEGIHLFTGIIQDIGKIRKIERRDQGLQLDIATHLDLSALKLGDSVAVDGACLTVIRKTPSTFSAEIGKETLERTTLSRAKDGQAVNLETALKISDFLSGHFVTGHVDGTGEIIGMTSEGSSFRYRFRTPAAIARYLIGKGSIAVDGISLTVAEGQGEEFSVSVLPYTVNQTTLSRKRLGDPVNLEVDMIAKYVEKFVHPGRKSETEDSRISLSFLAEHGFAKKIG